MKGEAKRWGGGKGGESFFFPAFVCSITAYDDPKIETGEHCVFRLTQECTLVLFFRDHHINFDIVKLWTTEDS